MHVFTGCTLRRGGPAPDPLGHRDLPGDAARQAPRGDRCCRRLVRRQPVVWQVAPRVRRGDPQGLGQAVRHRDHLGRGAQEAPCRGRQEVSAVSHEGEGSPREGCPGLGKNNAWFLTRHATPHRARAAPRCPSPSRRSVLLHKLVHGIDLRPKVAPLHPPDQREQRASQPGRARRDRAHLEAHRPAPMLAARPALPPVPARRSL